jgi:hypothetical protein
VAEPSVTGEELDASDVRVRARIIANARAQIGAVTVSEYWRDVLGPDWTGPFPKHWCGAFCLAMLHSVGAATDILWEVGKGFLFRLPRAKDPQPGDVVYFDKPFQHHALFVRYDGDHIVTIDGNQGAPWPVCERRRAKNKATAIYSVANLLPYQPDTIPAPAPEGDDL